MPDEPTPDPIARLAEMAAEHRHSAEFFRSHRDGEDVAEQEWQAERADAIEAVLAELDQLRRQAEADRVTIARLEKERYALIRLCILDGYANQGKWYSFVGAWGPVPFRSLKMSPTLALAEAAVRKAAGLDADAPVAGEG
jgi:hypothetical protein